MQEAEDVIAAETAGLTLQCRAGCHYCCHQQVMMTSVADGEAILAAARDALDAQGYAELVARLRTQAAEIARPPQPGAAPRRWTCPLLRDGRCLVYAVRPVACRSVVSSDAECCRALLSADSWDDVSPAHQVMAEEIGRRSTRIQLAVNFRRPVDGVFELRELLVALIDRDHGPAA